MSNKDDKDNIDDKNNPAAETSAEKDDGKDEILEEELIYTENDIVTLDGEEYHTNFTNKYLTAKNYVPRLKDVEMRAFLPGQIIKVYIKKKKKVKAFEKLISFEAMKMINEITLNDDVKIDEVFVKKGDTVEKNQLLFKYKVIPKK
ncbi:MAG TPA: hypothetical protein PLK90_03875 [Clostridiales bacterium]|nr:hypothetical protein [Clostridiales bacterium]HQP69519.1 hypothetical protein [Clostridiales bacterium]